MDRVKRIGVSLEPELLERLDEIVQGKGFPSRSEAIRDLIRERLNEERLQDPNADAVGSVTILYNHHETGLSDKLTRFQHDRHRLIISTTHIHLDEDLCLEILVCRGRAGDIKDFADRVSAIKGVRQGAVSLSSVSAGGKPDRRHVH